MESVIADVTGVSVDQFAADLNDWLAGVKYSRWNRAYTNLIYQPLLEVMQYLRTNGYMTYIVTGVRQDFLCGYAEHVRCPP